ncbi:MAG: GIY-YIG nuclease family protein [Candidatus Aenigmarchaeota archaeon]|nr:GIY-YIG nuclease family protein [Candidatus Aenigmarchaeota archaeon]
MFYVYVLRCRDGSLYTGYTNDLKTRIAKHSCGKASKFTRSRLPVELIAKRAFASKSEAMKHEIRFKAMTRKDKLSAIRKHFKSA